MSVDPYSDHSAIAENLLAEADSYIDMMKPNERLRYLIYISRERYLYWAGFVAGVGNFAYTGFGGQITFLITPAYAADGPLAAFFLGKNYIATLLFFAFLGCFLAAVFGKGPGRTTAETLAKLLAGGLVGYLGGARS